LVSLGPVTPLDVVVVIVDFVVLVGTLVLLDDFTDVLEVLDLLLDLLEGEAVTVTTFVEVEVERGGV
jgi:hypothetical protein